MGGIASAAKSVVSGGPIGSLLGLNGGAGGTGFTEAQGANIVNPVQPGQINTAYGGTQGSLEAQQNLLKAIQAQNGLGNQSQVYNQLQGVVNGTGPNPAQAMLNHATGQNVANQAALMAGQRGAASNVGLIARQAAQQGSAAQQDAATQAATLQANQSLGALGQAGAMAGQQASNQIGQTNNNNAAQQAQQNALINAQLGVNTANVGSQGSINAANAGLANTQLQGQQNFIGGLMGGLGSAGGMLGGAGGAASAGAPTAMAGGFGEAASAAPLVMAAAKGGSVPAMAQGGPVQGPSSSFGKFLSGFNQSYQGGAQPSSLQSGMTGFMNAFKPQQQGAVDPMAGYAGTTMAGDYELQPGQKYAKGGKVPVMVSPGEKYLSPQDVEQVKAGASPIDVGKTVPGKPKVGGAKNSYSNDTVPMDAEEGAIIVPRSDTQAKDKHEASTRFVEQILANRKAGC